MWSHRSAIFSVTLTLVSIVGAQEDDCQGIAKDLVRQGVFSNQTRFSTYRCCNFGKGTPLKLGNHKEMVDLEEKLYEAMSYCYDAHAFTRKTMKMVKTTAGKWEKENFDGYDCIYECVMVRSGIMSESKILDKEKLTNLAIYAFGTEELEDALYRAIPLCFERKYYSDLYSCPDGLDGFETCIRLEMIANCPPTMSLRSDECEVVRSYLQACLPEVLAGQVRDPRFF